MIIILLVVLGLSLGSFVNALVWRLRQQAVGSKKLKKRYSILSGRSMCTHCKHDLAWYDLMPVVSWFLLRGKCRYCQKPVSWQYPAIEVGTAALFMLSYVAWPNAMELASWDGREVVLLGFWLMFLTGFMALTVYDLRWMELPNRIVYALISLAALRTLFLVASDVTDVTMELADVFWGLLAVGGLFYGLFQVSGGKWIGGGDVKLGLLIGMLVGGALPGIAVVFLASVLGTIVSIPLLAANSAKANSRIPFGPFLIAATIVVYLYGQQLSDWYWNILLA